MKNSPRNRSARGNFVPEGHGKKDSFKEQNRRRNRRDNGLSGLADTPKKKKKRISSFKEEQAENHRRKLGQDVSRARPDSSQTWRSRELWQLQKSRGKTPNSIQRDKGQRFPLWQLTSHGHENGCSPNHQDDEDTRMRQQQSDRISTRVSLACEENSRPVLQLNLPLCGRQAENPPQRNQALENRPRFLAGGAPLEKWLQWSCLSNWWCSWEWSRGGFQGWSLCI